MSIAKLRDEVLPAVFKKRGRKLVRCEFDSSTVGQDQFMSSVVFLSAVVEDDENVTSLPLVVKFEPFSVELRDYLKTNIQFHNEVLMYERIIPFLDKSSNIRGEIFAEFYHGVGRLDDGSDDNIVILENLRPRGFRLSADRLCLDYQHLSAAMKKLGTFHALSYTAKKESPVEFHALASALEETTWRGETTLHRIVKACFHRPAEHLIERGRHVDVLRRLLDSFDSVGVNGFMRRLVTPEEPLAVVCHGDFCRNNILFRYDGGDPVDVRLFDVATSRYSSPAVDISFLLLLNGSRETRRERWDDLLAVYHRALSNAVLPGAGVPTLDDVRDEVTAKALYGFVHCAFFLPLMAFEHPYDSLEKVMNADQDTVAEDYARIGGEDGTRLLADMLEDLVARGCVTLGHEFMLSRTDDLERP